MRKLILILPLLFASVAHAQCTGGPINISCPGNVTSTQIQAAVNAASNGFVITVATGGTIVPDGPSGTPLRWTNTKGGRFVCAVIAKPPQCAINIAPGPAGIASLSSFSGTNTNLYEFAGFAITSTIQQSLFSVGLGCGGSCNGSFPGPTGIGGLFFHDNVITNNYNGQANPTFFFTGNQANFQGAIANNDETCLNSCQLFFGTGWTTFTGSPTLPSGNLGTVKNLFLENNSLKVITETNSNYACADFWGLVAVVARYNTVTNCLWSSHAESYQGGPANFEYYNNSIINDSGGDSGFKDCYRSWHPQGGGTSMVFNNTCTPFGLAHNATPLSLGHYRGYEDSVGPVSNISVSGSTVTITGTFSDPAGTPPTTLRHGWYMINGSAVPQNNTGILIPANGTATTLTGSSTFFANDPGSTATAYQAVGDLASVTCDGTITAAHFPPYADGNRAPTSTWRGYPCFNQPGRDTLGNYVPIYSWNNTFTDNGAQMRLTIEHAGGHTIDYYPQHIISNREYFNDVIGGGCIGGCAQIDATHPFDGTMQGSGFTATGMGFGTLARRPTTCTTSTEAGAGVGYFATNVGAQGTLYTCSATNTWTSFYVPYTYPHPLISGPAAPGVTFTPTTVSFGFVTQGTVSSELQTTLTNTGTANLVLGTPAVALSDTTNFTLVGADTTCTNALSIVPGGTCVIAAKANPTGLLTYTSTLTTLSNAASSPDTGETFTVTGAAVAPPGNPVLIGAVWSNDMHTFYPCTPYPCATICYACSLPFGSKVPKITFK